MPERKINPSDGERRALVGYIGGQYRLCAELAYDALVKGRLEWLQLLSDTAGRVDDFLLGSKNRVDAYQVKHGEEAETYTLCELLRPQKTSSGNPAAALFRQLSLGWQTLRSAWSDYDVHVHLALRGIPTIVGGIPSLPTTIHRASFQKFIEEGWKEKSSGVESAKWRDVSRCISEICGLQGGEFEDFRHHCHLEFFPKVEPKPYFIDDKVELNREIDIEKLKQHLLNLASGDAKPGQISGEQLLRDLGWEKRFQIEYRHDFRIDPRYQPIQSTVEAILQALSKFDRGYLALIGSPGSGKSTTLTDTLRQQKHYRLIRYYAFIPDDALLARGEAHSFLHDVVVQLRQQGVQGRRGFAPDSMADLQNELSSQLEQLAQEWHEQGQKTVILIDGLDHIEREQNPMRSLLTALPSPNSIPQGVLVCLGSQKMELRDLDPSIQTQLAENGRTIQMDLLSRQSVYAYLTASNLPVGLVARQREKVFDRCEGHPLALALIVEQLLLATEGEEVNSVLECSATFQNHIEKTYETHWNRFETDEQLTLLLAYIARIRGAADLKPLVSLVGEAAVKKLRQCARPYLLFINPTQCKFFHNSFRQFVLKKTGRDPFGETDQERHRRLHRNLAEAAARLELNQPFSWEAVYHAHCAGAFERLLEFATAEYFRAQSKALRHSRLIFEDLGFVFSATREANRPLAAISAMLIFREVRRRFHDVEELGLPELLLALRGPDECLEQAIQRGALTIPPMNALRICEALVDVGHLPHAARIFEMVEPLTLLDGGSLLELHSAQDNSILMAWASVAWRFRPVVDVARGILQAQIGTDRLHRAQPVGEVVAKHRFAALQTLLHSLVDHQEFERLEETLQFLSSVEFFPALRRTVDRRLCAQHPTHQHALAALKRLETDADDSDPDLTKRLFLATQAWRIRRDPGEVERWLKPAEPLRTPQRLGMTGGLGPFQNRLSQSRLLAIAGTPLAVVETIAIPSDIQKHVPALVDRAVAQVGTLWGQGVVGKRAELAEIRKLASMLIRFFDQDLRSFGDHMEWDSVQRDCSTLFEWLIHAVATHGKEALGILADEFDRRWAVSPPKWPWSLHTQREIALILHGLDEDTPALIRRLERFENGIEVEDDPTERVDFFRRQTLGWVQAEQKTKAECCFVRMVESTCAIRSGEEDDEAFFWVKWWASQAKESNSSVRTDIELLASALSVLERGGRGRLSGEAMNLLAQTAGTFSEQWSQHLWFYWFEMGAVHWATAIRGVLHSLLGNSQVPLETLAVAIRRLFLPWDIAHDEKLPSAIAAALYRTQPNEDPNRILESLIDTLKTNALPSIRKKWFDAIAHAAEEAGRLPPRMPIVEIDDDLSTQPSIEHAPVVKTPDGSERPFEQALLAVTSANAAVNLLKVNPIGYPVREDLFVERTFDRLHPSERIEFARLAIQQLSSAEMLSAIAQKFVDLRLPHLAQSVAERALECLDGQAWLRIYDHGICVSVVKALVAADPAGGRKRAFDQWLRNLIEGEAPIPESFEQFENLLDLLIDPLPHEELWQMLRAHFLQFVEVRENSKRIPPLACPPSALPPGATVISLLERGCNLGVSEVEDQCFRGIVELVLAGKCGFFRDLPVVFYWAKTRSPRIGASNRSRRKIIRKPLARLFLWAERVRYAWRPAALRTGVRKSSAAARQPTRIHGAISLFCSSKQGFSMQRVKMAQ